MAALTPARSRHGDNKPHGIAGLPRNDIPPSGEPLGIWFDIQRTAGRTGALLGPRRAARHAVDPQWATPAARLKGAARLGVAARIEAE